MITWDSRHIFKFPWPKLNPFEKIENAWHTYTLQKRKNSDHKFVNSLFIHNIQFHNFLVNFFPLFSL